MNVNNNFLIVNSNSNYFNCKGFKIIFINVNRLLSHLNEVKVFVDSTKADMYCICESWLTNDISDPEIAIQGYNHWRTDRLSRMGGGVIIYTKNNFRISYETTLSSNEFGFEILVLKVKHEKARPFYVGCLYRPPNCRTVSDEKIIETISGLNQQELILGGDVNVDELKRENRNWFSKLCDLGFSQIIRPDKGDTEQLNHY